MPFDAEPQIVNAALMTILQPPVRVCVAYSAAWIEPASIQTTTKLWIAGRISNGTPTLSRQDVRREHGDPAALGG